MPTISLSEGNEITSLSKDDLIKKEINKSLTPFFLSYVKSWMDCWNSKWGLVFFVLLILEASVLPKAFLALSYFDIRSFFYLNIPAGLVFSIPLVGAVWNRKKERNLIRKKFDSELFFAEKSLEQLKKLADTRLAKRKACFSQKLVFFEKHRSELANRLQQMNLSGPVDDTLVSDILERIKLVEKDLQNVKTEFSLFEKESLRVSNLLKSLEFQLERQKIEKDEVVSLGDGFFDTVKQLSLGLSNKNDKEINTDLLVNNLVEAEELRNLGSRENRRRER